MQREISIKGCYNLFFEIIKVNEMSAGSAKLSELSLFDNWSSKFYLGTSEANRDAISSMSISELDELNYKFSELVNSMESKCFKKLMKFIVEETGQDYSRLKQHVSVSSYLNSLNPERKRVSGLVFLEIQEKGLPLIIEEIEKEREMLDDQIDLLQSFS